jgi:mRNA-degrading endonuclease RelE of RelBE toxin-antitoxin system
MNYSILPTHRFEIELKRLVRKFPSLRKEFAELIADLSQNPYMGVFVGNNCYKIRMAIASKGKGKSGGARVITHLYVETEIVYLLTIYDKSEKEDISDKELAAIIDTLEL